MLTVAICFKMESKVEFIHLCFLHPIKGLIIIITIFQWRYNIRLENLGEDSIQLRERHWNIFTNHVKGLHNSHEKNYEHTPVHGRGIIGKVVDVPEYYLFISFALFQSCLFVDTDRLLCAVLNKPLYGNF